MGTCIVKVMLFLVGCVAVGAIGVGVSILFGKMIDIGNGKHKD